MSRDDLDQISIVRSGSTRRAFIKSGGVVIGGVMLGGGVLAACGDDDDESSAARSGGGQQEIETMDFQVRWLEEVSFSGWFAGQEFGWFEEEGIDLNLIPGGPNLDVQQIIAGGGPPVGAGFPDQIIRGRVEQNIPFVMFGALYQVSPAAFMSFAEKNITTPEDMVDKRIATTAGGRPIVNALLRSVGLPEDQWEYVPSGFDPTPLIEDQADLFHGFRTGQGVVLELDGYEMNYLTMPDFDYNPYETPVFALEETLADQEDLLTRFLRSSIKGWEWATANPEGAAKMTVEKYGRDGLTIEQQTAEGEAQVSDVKTGETDEKGLFVMDTARWDDMITFLQEAGGIKSTIPGAEIVNTDIQAAAMDGKSQLLSEQELQREFT
jgi:ABC-type nitrate/sulfonate/bicarbonate transport system substrate-binding protein